MRGILLAGAVALLVLLVAPSSACDFEAPGPAEPGILAVWTPATDAKHIIAVDGRSLGADCSMETPSALDGVAVAWVAYADGGGPRAIWFDDGTGAKSLADLPEEWHHPMISLHEGVAYLAMSVGPGARIASAGPDGFVERPPLPTSGIRQLVGPFAITSEPMGEDGFSVYDLRSGHPLVPPSMPMMLGLPPGSHLVHVDEMATYFVEQAGTFLRAWRVSHGAGGEPVGEVETEGEAQLAWTDGATLQWVTGGHRDGWTLHVLDVASGERSDHGMPPMEVESFGPQSILLGAYSAGGLPDEWGGSLAQATKKDTPGVALPVTVALVLAAVALRRRT